MTTKHTPGPWKWMGIFELYQVKSICDGGPFGESVISVCHDDRGEYIEATDANRTLIAAAPDLLEALEAAHGYLVMMGTDHADHIRGVCRAAIAKATGVTPL